MLQEKCSSGCKAASQCVLRAPLQRPGPGIVINDLSEQVHLELTPTLSLPVS